VRFPRATRLPLHRQARRMKREGFDVGTGTLSEWVRRGADLLEVLAKAVKRELLAGDYLQGDDTGLPVQDGNEGALRKGRLWAFTDQEQVFYAFTATRRSSQAYADAMSKYFYDPKQGRRP
jgi:hypothetical protein